MKPQKIKLFAPKTKFFERKYLFERDYDCKTIDSETKTFNYEPVLFFAFSKPYKSRPILAKHKKNNVFGVFMLQQLYDSTDLWGKYSKWFYLRKMIKSHCFLFGYRSTNVFLGDIPSHILIKHLSRNTEIKENELRKLILKSYVRFLFLNGYPFKKEHYDTVCKSWP